jgi:hypothetical protein
LAKVVSENFKGLSIPGVSIMHKTGNCIIQLKSGEIFENVAIRHVNVVEVFSKHFIGFPSKMGYALYDYNEVECIVLPANVDELYHGNTENQTPGFTEVF